MLEFTYNQPQPVLFESIYSGTASSTQHDCAGEGLPPDAAC